LAVMASRYSKPEPQAFRSRLAVAFAPEKTAEHCDHPLCLSQ
jgi:hypothetical protein